MKQPPRRGAAILPPRLSTYLVVAQRSIDHRLLVRAIPARDKVEMPAGQVAGEFAYDSCLPIDRARLWTLTEIRSGAWDRRRDHRMKLFTIGSSTEPPGPP